LHYHTISLPFPASWLPVGTEPSQSLMVEPANVHGQKKTQCTTNYKP
jgi:hypothetical protein